MPNLKLKLKNASNIDCNRNNLLDYLKLYHKKQQMKTIELKIYRGFRKKTILD